MKQVTLTRLKTGPQGTLGRLDFESIALYTLELPWNDNKNDVSCIPEGKYWGVWSMSPHFHREMYAIIPVKGRAGIRFHSANFAGNNPPFHKQLNGCIALGERYGLMDGQLAVLLSRPAVRSFEEVMQKQSFILEIKNSWA